MPESGGTQAKCGLYTDFMAEAIKPTCKKRIYLPISLSGHQLELDHEFQKTRQLAETFRWISCQKVQAVAKGHPLLYKWVAIFRKSALPHQAASSGPGFTSSEV